MHGDQCFGHLPVVGCLADEDVCQVLIQGNCVFCSFYKTDPYSRMLFCHWVGSQLPKFFMQSAFPSTNSHSFLGRLLHTCIIQMIIMKYNQTGV